MFLHTRDAGTLSSVCTLCGHVIRARADRDVYLEQRGHDAFTCQLRRAENARVVLVEVAPAPAPKPERTHCANGHDWTPVNVYVNARGHSKCRACSRERQAAKAWRCGSRVSPAMTTELGVSVDRITSAKTTRPARKRLDGSEHSIVIQREESA